MKVLVIGSRIPFPLHDGGAIATYNMLKGLAQNGVDVTYLSLNTNKHFVEEKTLQHEFSFLKSIKAYTINTDIRIIDAFKNLFSNTSYNIERFYSPGFESLLTHEIAHHSYDIIHFEGLFVAKYIEKIKSVCSIPTILRQHNIEYQIWERLADNEKNPFKRWYLQLLSKRIKTFELNISKSFDDIVTIADTDETIIKQWQGIKSVSTIPSGFEISSGKNPEKLPEIKHSVYHIGSMEWLPNRDAMMWFHHKVWPLVIKIVPDAKFFMAGKNMPSDYNSWATDNFEICGEVKNVTSFSADKQILVVPLKSASGIRIKTIEAMIAAKAVVTTSLGAKGLPVINGQHCMIADDEIAFANAVIFLLQNPERRHAMEKEGRELIVANYELNEVARQWINHYRLIAKY